MTAPGRITFVELIALAKDCADSLPGDERIMLVHRGADGEAKARVCFRGALPVKGAPSVSRPPLPLNETEQTIVDAIDADQNLTGDEIADRTGYTYDGWFRGQLASMRKREILTGAKGEPGYGVSMAYRQ